MPGIFGIIDYEKRPDGDLFLGLSKKISPIESANINFSSDQALLGFKSLGIVDYIGQPFTSHDDALKLFIWGEVFDKFPDGESLAAHIFSLYSDRRLRELGAINGFLSLALWDTNKDILMLSSDLQGTRPLYFYQDRSRFIFGPNPFDLANILGLAELDTETLAEFLAFGIIFGDHTWIRNINKLRYGQYLRLSQDGLEITQYFRPKYCPEKISMQEAGDAILEKLRQAVTRMSLGKTALSLSGGSDSRLVAAVLKDRKISIPAFTYGGPESRDMEIAPKVAALAGMKHYPLQLDANFLKESLSQVVYKTVGHVSALNFHGISTSERAKEICDVYLTGLCGNDILGYLSRAIIEFLFIRNQEIFHHRLLEYFNHGFKEKELKGLLNYNFDRAILYIPIKKLIMQHHQEIALETLASINHFELNGQSSQAGVWLENDILESRDPFSDLDVVKLNFAIPARYKLLVALGFHIWRHHYADLGAIEFQRTGLPLNCSPMKMLLSRIASKIKRDPPTPKPGILDYSRFFLKNKEWLKAILLDEQFTETAKINPDSIIRLLHDQNSGRAHNTAHIGILLTVRQVIKLLNG